MADFRGIPAQLEGSTQENVLALVSSSDRYCSLVVQNVPVELYSDRTMRDLATQVYNYVHLYRCAPKDHLPDLVEDRLQEGVKDAEVMRQILETIHGLLTSGFNEEYVVNQLTKFVRQQHLKQAVISVIEASEQGDVAKADDAIDKYRSTSYEQFSPGVTLREFAAQLGTVDRTMPIFKTGIDALDQAELGPARGELQVFMAPPKRGKTWWLLHLCKQALLARMRTVYITLEVSPEIIAGRLMQGLFAMTRHEGDKAVAGCFNFDTEGNLKSVRNTDLKNRLAFTSKEGMSKIKKVFTDNTQIARLSDNLRIQRFPTGALKMREVSAYLENLVSLNRFMPDVVILDYADLMYVDVRNYRLALGQLYKDLRGIAVERNLAMLTASQSNRASLSSYTIDERHTAEDISKIAISDAVITYNQTESERALNVARLHVAVARTTRDKFTVNITQAYSIGQFCTESKIIPAKTYEKLIPRKPIVEDEDEDPADEEPNIAPTRGRGRR